MIKFISKHNKTKLFIQDCNVSRQTQETAEEWIRMLRIETLECNYKKNVRHLEEQIINRIFHDAAVTVLS